MKTSSHMPWGRTLLLGILSLAGVILLTVGLYAKPDPPRQTPNLPGTVKPRIVPRGKAVMPVPHRYRRVRYMTRQRHYWQPYYKNLPPKVKVIYDTVGYPYYTGGTDYIAVPTESARTTTINDSSNAAEAKASVPEGESHSSVECYEQIQQLTELVHEWRTMNESPEVHQRLEALTAPGVYDSVAAKMRTENEQFDQSSRQAMKLLAQGHDATEPLATSQSQLNKLTALLAALPEPVEPSPPADGIRSGN